MLVSSWSGGGKKITQDRATGSLKKSGYFTGGWMGSKGSTEKMQLSSRQNSLDGQKG